MAKFLRAHPVDVRMAGWNVGIVGYFLDGKVTNLDGLMNDQIYPYMHDGTAEQYIKNSEIKYIVDFPLQISSPINAKISGYDSGSMSAHLRAIHTVTSDDRSQPWRDYTLFRIENSAAVRQIK